MVALWDMIYCVWIVFPYCRLKKIEKLEKTKGVNGVLFIVVVFMLSLVPLFSMMGNILPSVAGIRIHQIWNGALLLLSFVFIKKDNWRLYTFFGLYTLVMCVIFSFNVIIVLVDHFSGVIVLLNIVGNVRFEKVKIDHLINLFIGLSLIPIFVAILQVVNILPYEIGSTGYVNVATFQGMDIKRPNGGLFHPYELVIFTFIPFVLLYYKYQKIVLLLIAIPLLYVVKIKTGILLALMYFIIVLFQIYKIKWRKILIYQRLILLTVCIIVPILIVNFDIILRNIGIHNYQELLTGRGIIWQIYGVSFWESSLYTKIFGFWDISTLISDSGMYYNKDYNPGPHNSYFEILLCCGLVGVYLLYIFYKRIFKTVTNLLDYTASMKLVYFAVILVMLTLAMTGDMLYTFYFYTGILFLIKNALTIDINQNKR